MKPYQISRRVPVEKENEMSTENKYVATFTTSCQISIDFWDVYQPTLSINANTTVGEIMAWANKKTNGQSEVKIIKLDEL